MLDRPVWFEPAFIEAAIGALPIAALVTDPEFRIVYANPAFEQLVGYGRDELLGNPTTMLLSSDADPDASRAVADELTAGRIFHGELRFGRRDGTEFWTSLAITPVFDATGGVRAFVGVQSNISTEVSARQQAEDLTLTAEVLLGTASRLAAAVSARDVAQALANGLLGGGAERSITVLADPRTSSMVLRGAGWPDIDGVLQDVAEIVSDREWLHRPAGETRGMTGVSDTGTVEDGWRAGSPAIGAERVAELMRKWGVNRYFAEPVIAGQGVQGLLVACWATGPARSSDDAVVMDRVTRLAELGAVSFANVALLEQIRASADVDQLTGVLSRSRMRERLEQAVTESHARAGVLFVDVDRFKRLNDSLGHAGGDELLVQVAGRLAAAVGEDGFVGRPGGDEFVVVLPSVRDLAGAEAVAARIDLAMRDGFLILERSVHASVSVGCEVGGRALLESADDAAERLIRAADRAMYLVKERRRSRRRTETTLDVVVVESELHAAVRRKEITTDFQPVFDLRTGLLTGFEALARWRHAQLGDIPPGVFIPLAEEAGLISEIGRTVLRDGCAFLDRAAAGRPLQLHVNVSLHQLVAPGFVDCFAAVLDDHPDRSWSVTAEIAEPDLATERAEVAEAVHRLGERGVEITIDAFGSGFTSLSRLQDLPVAGIKVDKGFVRRAGALGSGMIGAIVSLARGLGLEVLAEGVETHEQLEALRGLGIDRAQGFLLAPPLPAEQAANAPATIEEALALRTGNA